MSLASAADAASGSCPALVYLDVVLRALLREEALERRPRRLLEPKLATWQRFRGRLGDEALVELLLEDAAVTQPCPFAPVGEPDLVSLLAPLRSSAIADALGRVLAASDETALPTDDYIRAQARRLGVVGRAARSDLPEGIKPNHRVLEVPGTGGQLTHYVAQRQAELSLKDVFTIAAGGWQEWTLAGVVAVECRVVGKAPVVIDAGLQGQRGSGEAFDHVIGLEPAKGGAFTMADLQQWFPHSRITLV